MITDRNPDLDFTISWLNQSRSNQNTRQNL